MEKYTVTFFEGITSFDFEGGQTINIFNSTGYSVLFTSDTETTKQIQLTEALQRITNAEKIN